MRDSVLVLDTQQSGRRGITASTAIDTGDGLALFDCGPESTFDNIAADLEAAGHSAREVRHVFLSHIHLDHAGAAWRFAELGARIYVHPRGAAHLIDPTKLIESATRIFGENMEKLWGRIAPVPQNQLQIANDGDQFQVGNVAVRALATPGHASHHNIYHWDDNVFGGDVAGVRLGSGPPIPPFVPPELQLEQWLESIETIRKLDPARIYLPHFGVVDGNVAPHLEALTERVHRWGNWFRDALRAGRADAELIPSFAAYEADDLRAAGAPEEAVTAYECADPSFMAVTAGLRYWKKYHPEALTVDPSTR